MKRTNIIYGTGFVIYPTDSNHNWAYFNNTKQYQFRNDYSTSSILPEKPNKLYLNQVDPDILSLVIGRILGDGHLEITRGSKNARLLSCHSIKQKEYIFHVYEQLRAFTKTPPKMFSYILKNKTYEIWKFATQNCQFLTELYTIFYNNKLKVIPLNIEEFLTPKALAYWSIDDGYKQGTSFVLSTDSFTKEEVELLIIVLKRIFDFDCTLYKANSVKGYYRIYIRARSMSLFRELVTPHFHESMMYKLQ